MTPKIGIITIFPPKNTLHGSGASGVGSYTKNLIKNFPTSTQNDIVVLCDFDEKNTKSSYKEGDYLVDRCWTRKGFFQFIGQILNSLKKHHDIKTIHIQHEFNMFGSIWTIPFVWLLLIRLKLMGIKTIITFHGLSSPKIINQKYCTINLLPRYLPAWLIKLAFLAFYGVSRFFLDHIIVHEDYFSKILIQNYGYNKKNISIIHHGIENINPSISQKEARIKLQLPDKKIILYFGFIAGYKGVELLLDGFEQLNDEYHLIIAGGIPKRTAKDPLFIAWYEKLEHRIKKINNLTRIGFVPDEDIETLFVASDLLIIPYVYMLAASGPMSLAIAYGLPFLISRKFQPVISEKSMIFDLNGDSLSQTISHYFEGGHTQIVDYLKLLRESRSWPIIASQTDKLY